MSGGRGRTKKSISARIKICGTGKNVDDAMKSLVDEWLVPNLVEAFFEQLGLAEPAKEPTAGMLRSDAEAGN